MYPELTSDPHRIKTLIQSTRGGRYDFCSDLSDVLNTLENKARSGVDMAIEWTCDYAEEQCLIKTTFSCEMPDQDNPGIDWGLFLTIGAAAILLICFITYAYYHYQQTRNQDEKIVELQQNNCDQDKRITTFEKQLANKKVTSDGNKQNIEELTENNLNLTEKVEVLTKEVNALKIQQATFSELSTATTSKVVSKQKEFSSPFKENPYQSESIIKMPSSTYKRRPCKAHKQIPDNYISLEQHHLDYTNNEEVD